MPQYDKKSLKHLADQFKISSGLDSVQHIELLDQIKQYPQHEAVQIINYFASIETNPDILYYLLKRIEAYKDPSSIDVLSDLLLSKSGNAHIVENMSQYVKIRSLAAKVLSSFKDNKAVLPLLYILNSKEEDYKLRLNCAEALGKLGNNYAVSPLIDIVSDKTEQSIYLKESATKALGMIGDMRAVEPLVAILESNESFISKFSFLKERILETLRKIGAKDDRTFKAIKKSLLDNSPFVRIDAIEALSELDDDRVIPLIEDRLFDEDEEVAKSAVVALYNILGEEYLFEMRRRPDIPLCCIEEAEAILDDNEDEYNED